MAIFQIDIEKKALAGVSTGEFWTNRYLVQAATLSDAVLYAPNLYNMERDIHTGATGFTKCNVRDVDPSTDIYSTIPLNFTGTYGGGIPEDLLPAMLVMRVDLGVATGRPSRKYYHLMLGEGSQSNGGWNAAVLADVGGNWTSLLAAAGTALLCDPQGAEIVSAAPKLEVTVHQFRRGSKRKLQPILP